MINVMKGARAGTTARSGRRSMQGLAGLAVLLFAGSPAGGPPTAARSRARSRGWATTPRGTRS
jgi:hypothetical protein